MTLAVNFISFACLTIGLLMLCYANGSSIVAAKRQSKAAYCRAGKIRSWSTLIIIVSIAMSFATFTVSK